MIYCIVAVERNQGIGYNGQMPWPHLSGDMKWFKERTTGNTVIMGATTWKGFAKPLPNRTNVVISSQPQPGATVLYSNPERAINELKNKGDIYIMGGQALYDSVKHLVDVFYVTEIDADYTCDKFFDLDYVKKTCPNVKDVLYYEAADTTPAYTIKEYTK